jgi:flagellar L-ring protein precursor FlgH
MSSNVTLNIASQVVETLPNGVLVVQASRDLAVGNDRQTVILRGLVRPGDIALDNSISSNAISNLQVEIKGKGAVAEITRQPNIVIRTLLKLFTF